MGAAAPPAPMRERRNSPRVNLALPIYVIADGAPPVPGTLEDLSASGLRFTVGMHVPLDGTVTLTIDIIRGRCEAVGPIVRVSDDALTVAVQFTSANEAMQSFVQDLTILPPADRTLFLERILDPRIRITSG